MTTAADPRFPNRPQHPDFQKMSAAVRALDAAGDSGQSLEEIVAGHDVDVDSLIYMANQRALRAVLLFESSPAPDEAKYSANWIDGFMAGLKIERDRPTPIVVDDSVDGNRRQGGKS